MNFDEMVQKDETVAPARRGLELRRQQDVGVGGLPSVSLLPRELRAAARDRSLRRIFVLVTVGALVLAGGATGGAVALAAAAQSRLDTETAESQALLVQVGRFADVAALQQSIRVGDAAVKVGSSAEIDWKAQIDEIEAEMPYGYAVTTITADGATAIADYPQGTTPLEKPRAGTLVLTVTADSVTGLPRWLRKIRAVPAYADATTVVSSDDGSGYVVELTVHIAPNALVHAKKAAR